MNDREIRHEIVSELIEAGWSYEETHPNALDSSDIRRLTKNNAIIEITRDYESGAFNIIQTYVKEGRRWEEINFTLSVIFVDDTITPEEIEKEIATLQAVWGEDSDASSNKPPPTDAEGNPNYEENKIPATEEYEGTAYPTSDPGETLREQIIEKLDYADQAYAEAIAGYDDCTPVWPLIDALAILNGALERIEQEGLWNE